MPYNIHGLGKKNEVHVLNQLPENSPQLELHCASGDDDLGYNYPKVGSDFNWRFDAWARTLFFCHFWWGDKDKAFDLVIKLIHQASSMLSLASFMLSFATSTLVLLVPPGHSPHCGGRQNGNCHIPVNLHDIGASWRGLNSQFSISSGATR
ncbi:hypothetical protein BC332_26570 [Capsicum chinense]|nr:hypothetical protein BC332_26570 [Capsicum chinense]